MTYHLQLPTRRSVMEIKALVTMVINTDTTDLKTEALAKDFIDELIFNTYKSNMHVFDEMDLEWV